MPDDQVLDLLLTQGGWLKRASFGWLPTSYLRTMPSFYRGIVPVIDHDHGSAPGLIKHSEAQPVHPPIAYMELCNRTDPYNKGRKLRLDPKKAAVEATEIAEERFLCEVHGQCPNIGPDGKKTKEWDPSTVCTHSNQSPTRTCGLEPVLQCKLLQCRTVTVSN